MWSSQIICSCVPQSWRQPQVMSAYLTEVAQNYRNGWILGLEVPLLGNKEMIGDDFCDSDCFDDDSLQVLEVPDDLLEFDDDLPIPLIEESNSRELHQDEDSNTPGVHVVRRPPKSWKKFLEIEKSGTEIFTWHVITEIFTWHGIFFPSHFH